MDLSMKWLNDYVKADMPIKEFCDGMTMSGSKVETWTKQGADITNVVVGKCVAMEKHPDADTLWVCQIDVGKDAPVQIVTSAQTCSLVRLFRLRSITLPATTTRTCPT